MNDYRIKKDEKGHDMFEVEMRWTDEDGKPHYTKTDDVDLAKNIIDLLTGEITLADLLP